MEELSVDQVIEFSQSIEEESHNFYTQASQRLTDVETKGLVEELAVAEVEHLNRLRNLVTQGVLSRGELKKRIRLDTGEYERVISSEAIPENPTTGDILERALAREKATRNTYQMLVAMTNLGGDIVKLFEYLYQQESGHVSAIEKRIRTV